MAIHCSVLSKSSIQYAMHDLKSKRSLHEKYLKINWHYSCQLNFNETLVIK